MAFYNILWVSIFALGGISLGILGMADLNLFTIFLINPRMFNRLIIDAESIYLSSSVPNPTVGALEFQRV
jgi:hypothetical protein